MGLNDTVSGERLHIGFFGMRNAGKSNLVNAVTGQYLSVVSDVKGTTTDPVKKAMELLPLGPVVIIDTPGFDDHGMLGELRVEKTREILSRVDIAVLVIDITIGMQSEDCAMYSLLQERKTPTVLVFNKADLPHTLPNIPDGAVSVTVSAAIGDGIDNLKEILGTFAKSAAAERFPVRDLLKPNDTVLLVTPIDDAAPKGRLILPQQMILRDILDIHAAAVLCQTEEVPRTLANMKQPPRMVITDSQVFGRVSKAVPDEIPLTSFSILIARYKGDLLPLVRGAAALSRLRDGDRVLISEGCTHHRQCNDIGTVKMPGWIEAFTGIKPVYTFTSGGEFPQDLTPFSLIVHCGGCMLNEKEMASRIRNAEEAGIPIVNYGIAIAHMHGILRRSLSLFPDALRLLD